MGSVVVCSDRQAVLPLCIFVRERHIRICGPILQGARRFEHLITSEGVPI